MNFSYDKNRLQAAYNANTDLQLMTELNRGSAREQMNFQKMMSDTAHQREVADLQRAGLNPALSLNNGASTPGGAYSSIDSSLSSARMQNKMQDKSIKAQMEMNEKSLENAYKVAEMQEAIRAKVQAYNTDKMYQLGIEQSKMSYDAAIKGLGNALDLARYNQSMESDRYYHPMTTEGYMMNTLYQTGASDAVNQMLADVVSDTLEKLGYSGAGSGKSSGWLKKTYETVKDWIQGEIDTTKAIKESNLKQKELEKIKKEYERSVLNPITEGHILLGYNPNKHDSSRTSSSAK